MNIKLQPEDRSIKKSKRRRNLTVAIIINIKFKILLFITMVFILHDIQMIIVSQSFVLQNIILLMSYFYSYLKFFLAVNLHVACNK